MNGSPREDSRTEVVCRTVEEILSKVNDKAETDTIALNRYILPLFDGKDSTKQNEKVQHFIERCTEADAFIICTPEYHNGISGALKNALDFLNKVHFHQKPVGILCASGSESTGLNALNQLRLVCRGLSGSVLTSQVVVSPDKINDDKQIDHEGVLANIENLIQELIPFAEFLKERRHGEYV